MVKILFSLPDPNEDGYPPVSVESVWARETERGGKYVIDNVPFFCRSATAGDTVAAVPDEDGNLWSSALVRDGGSTLVRVIFFDEDARPRVRGALRRRGCYTEYSGPFGILAVDVPRNASFDAVHQFMKERSEHDELDWEEILPHEKG